MEKIKVEFSPREIEALLNMTNNSDGLYVQQARRALMRVSRYAKYDIRDWSEELSNTDFWYQITFGPMAGLMVHAEDDVLTFDGGKVVLGIDSDSFFEWHPEFKEDDDE